LNGVDVFIFVDRVKHLKIIIQKNTRSMIMKIQPLFDNVLVEKIEIVTKSRSGLILPTSAIEKSNIGTIISVGSGEKLKDGSSRTLDVKEGDKVVYSYSTTEISIDGKNYLLMKESNILGVLPA
jgi:chaperonin GroES